jgi:hypothetical protein
MLTVLGLLHSVDVSDIHDVSELHTTSIFSFEVSKLVDFCEGMDRVGIGTSRGPITLNISTKTCKEMG